MRGKSEDKVDAIDRAIETSIKRMMDAGKTQRDVDLIEQGYGARIRALVQRRRGDYHGPK